MILGYSLLIIALVATVAANVLFVLSRRQGKEGLAKIAQTGVTLALTGIAGASAYLMYLIGTHQFAFKYVAEYTSKQSATRYLIAAFWGGQEGSILLWLFWTAILGWILARKSGKATASVWPIFGLIQLYLLGLLILKSPFKLGDGPIPTDGRGLNPLLQNPWMVIHPPILFLGFASTAVPGVWAVHGLLNRDFNGWVKHAFPWTLFSFATLGFGLALGGYWAYETLGWGGFWAWDPVENTSIVPWFLLTALLHGLALQVKNNGFRVSNFITAILPFAAMNYGTFLTRTGILADFSVHSFSSLGPDAYWVMLTAIILFTAGPIVLTFVRWKDIPKDKVCDSPVSREGGFAFASILMNIMGIAVAIGMSAPLITRIWMKQGSALQADFYNQVGFPIAIVVNLMMSLVPYLGWKTGDVPAAFKRLFKPYLAAIGVTLVMTVVSFVTHHRAPLMVLLFATSALAVCANVVLIIPRMKTKTAQLTVGGFTAHTGAAMVLGGIAILVAFQYKKEKIVLMKDSAQYVDGYKLTYLGHSKHPFDKTNTMKIKVEEGKSSWIAEPSYYFAPWEGKDTLFANPPAINRHILGDTYIALGGDTNEIMDDPDRAETPNNQFSLKVGEPKTIGDYTFSLMNVSFDDKAAAAFRAKDEKAFNALPEIQLKAIVSVKYQGQEILATPMIRQGKKSGTYSDVVTIPGPRKNVILRFVPPPTPDQVEEMQGAWMSAIEEAKKAGKPGTPAFQQALIPSVFLKQQAETYQQLATFQALRFETWNAPDPGEMAVIELSTKPMIWLVWLGSVLYSFGGVIAYRRRWNELVASKE